MQERMTRRGRQTRFKCVVYGDDAIFQLRLRPGSPQPACDATHSKALESCLLRAALCPSSPPDSVFGFVFSSCQQQNQTPKASSGMGASTGTAHPAVKDSKSRPITAGGFADGAPVIFIDVTAQAGFGHVHRHHRESRRVQRAFADGSA
jgi:hypothetical protein